MPSDRAMTAEDDKANILVDRDTDLTERQKAETRLWLQVLNVHRLIYDDLNATMLAGAGLSIPKFDALAHLYRYRDGLSMGELSKKMKVSNGNVSGLVARLQKDGYVDRKNAATDRRSFLATITDSGVEAFEKAVDLHHQVTSEKMAGVPFDMVEMLASNLKAISDRIRLSRETPTGGND